MVKCYDRMRVSGSRNVSILWLKVLGPELPEVDHRQHGRK